MGELWGKMCVPGVTLSVHLHTHKPFLGGWAAGMGCLSSHIMKCRCPVVLQTSQCDSSPLHKEDGVT